MVNLPDKQHLKAVLFDIDGTLVNSDPLHFVVWRELLLEKGWDGGKPLTKEFFVANLSGGHNPECVAELFPGISDEDNAAIADDKEARFRKLAVEEGLPQNKGLPEFLAWLKENGIRKAAVTNAPKLNMIAMLKAIGLYDDFDTIVLGEECARAKPHPDPYLDAAKALGVSTDEVFAVEDSPSGIASAVAGNIPVIALTTGQTTERLQSCGPTHIVDDFFQLAELVKAAQ